MALAAFTACRGRWRTAALALGCYAALTAVELGLRAEIGLVSGQTLRHALVHAYPSGHAARVPFFTGVLATLAPARWRWPLVAAGILLAAGVAVDRVDSARQTASDVIGGLLMGAWMALTFAALAPLGDRRPAHRPVDDAGRDRS